MYEEVKCTSCKYYDAEKLCRNPNGHYYYGEACIDYIENEEENHSADVSKKVDDAVNHPAHYTQGGIECIDALKAATVGLTGIEAVCTANAIKYLWRWKHKNGVEDIDKAIWYLERLKQEVQGRCQK